MRFDFSLNRRSFLKLWGLATLSLLLPRMSQARTAGIPVLLYHDISNEFRDEYTISPGLFAVQMEWLYANGYRAVSLRDIGAPGQAVPERAVVITFDDGYATFMDYAFPLLQQYGFKATINLVGEYVGTYMEMGGRRPMFGWDEYRHLARSGLVDIGCHTHALHKYGHLGVSGVSGDVLANDLRIFQETLRKQTGRNADILAWPYGLYTRKSIAVAVQAGFRHILTSRRGLFEVAGNPLEIPRRNISNGTDLISFKQYIGGGI